MYKKVLDNYSYALQFFPDKVQNMCPYKTQNMCNRAVYIYPSAIQCIPKCCKIEKRVIKLLILDC